MRVCRAGDGSNSTAAVLDYLKENTQLILADLYLIGEPENPLSFWVTNWDTPLMWPVWGTFTPAVIKRGSVTFKVGFEVSALDVEWSPPIGTFTNNVNTTSPYQLAQIGYFDNWPFRLWKVFMPTPGDANTFGACEWFGGRIAQSVVKRNSIKFTVNSFLDVVNQYCPTNVIELLNTVAAYMGARPPAGFSVVPQFNVLSGSSSTVVYCDCTSPSAHHVFSNDVFKHGYLMFNGGGATTLGGVFSALIRNWNSSGTINAFRLYTPLPWPPVAGVDTCYVSAPNPITQDEGDYWGFPFVPAPENAVAP